MPAIHISKKPTDIADQLLPLREDFKGSNVLPEPELRDAKIVVRPYCDQFTQQETADTAAKREATFITAIVMTIQGAATRRGLKLVSANADGQEMDGKCMVLTHRDYDPRMFIGHRRKDFDRAVDRFLRDPEVSEAALGAVEFDLVLPYRPTVPAYQYDPAAVDHACV